MRTETVATPRLVRSWPNNRSIADTFGTYISFKQTRSSPSPTKKVDGHYVYPTAYTLKRKEVGLIRYSNHSPANHQGYQHGTAEVPFYAWDYTFPTSGVPASNLVNKAIANVQQQQVAGGVFLGEAKSSLAMIALRANQLYKIFKYAKNLNVKGIMHMLKTSKRPTSRIKGANDLLLEYRFGWLPLVNDIHDACLALNSPNKARNSIITTSASNTESYETTERRTNYGVNEVSIHKELEQKVYLTYELKNPNGTLKERFGIDDPVKVAYELLPLSFVLDWFLPIGDFLTALNMSTNTVYLHGCFVHKVTSVVTSTNKSNSSFKPLGTASSKGITFRRSIIANAPLSLPRIQEPRSLGKAITAVQLILQRL